MLPYILILTALSLYSLRGSWAYHYFSGRAISKHVSYDALDAAF